MNTIRVLLTFSFILVFQSLFALNGVSSTYKKIENGYDIVASNENIYPVSIKYTFKLTNLTPSTKETIFVIPANSKDFKVLSLKQTRKGKPYTFTFTTLYNQGDHFKKDYDKDYEYYLPLKKGDSFKLYQGYNGSFSHTNENALDFTMPVGTEIYAAREGIVTNVTEHNDKTCGKPKCIEFNNLIRIYHSDGTFAEYTHIKKDGALVNVGEKVEKGQHIGYSGNVGFSTGPHLHFVVYFQRLEKMETVKTKFLIGDGKLEDNLIEKQF